MRRPTIEKNHRRGAEEAEDTEKSTAETSQLVQCAITHGVAVDGPFSFRGRIQGFVLMTMVNASRSLQGRPGFLVGHELR